MDIAESSNTGGSNSKEYNSCHREHKINKQHEVLEDCVPAAAKTTPRSTEQEVKEVLPNGVCSTLHSVREQHADPVPIGSEAFAEAYAIRQKHGVLAPVSVEDHAGSHGVSISLEGPVCPQEPSNGPAAEDKKESRPLEQSKSQAAEVTAAATQNSAAPTTGTRNAQPQPQPQPQPAPQPSYDRAAAGLSVHLLSLYKGVNEAFCRQRRLEGPGIKYNNGYDDKEGHYLVLSGEEILSRYTVQETLGKGSFGTVLRCYDAKRRESVALKITRHGLSFRTQAKMELDILLKLNANQHLNHLVVRLLKVFEWQGHLVLVFELLSFNLYQLIKCTRFNGVTLDLVRKFGYQLTQVLYYLEHAKPTPIIHCDLKPENVLLRNQNRSGIRLIDFGSACYSNKRVHKYIQSRFYRSPEVILHLGYGTPIDRWSLACLLVELHIGVPLFDGRTEAAQLARLEAVLGPIPVDLLRKSPKVLKFYEETATGFRLKEPPLPVRSLESVLGVTTGGPRGSRRGQAGHDEHSYRQFHDFIARLLVYNSEERMSCFDALRHPFLKPLLSHDQQQLQRTQSKPEQEERQQKQQQEPKEEQLSG